MKRALIRVLALTLALMLISATALAASAPTYAEETTAYISLAWLNTYLARMRVNVSQTPTSFHITGATGKTDLNIAPLELSFGKPNPLAPPKALKGESAAAQEARRLDFINSRYLPDLLTLIGVLALTNGGIHVGKNGRVFWAVSAAEKVLPIKVDPQTQCISVIGADGNAIKTSRSATILSKEPLLVGIPTEELSDLLAAAARL